MGFGQLGVLSGVPQAAPPWAIASDVNIDLDFVNNRGLQGATSGTVAQFIQQARTTTAYAVDGAGNWSSFAINVPRITGLGLTAEESRINSIRNNSMQGAVAGTPGTNPTNWVIDAITGVTRTLVGTGTENGIDYVEYNFNGTISGAQSDRYWRFETDTGVGASNGDVWTESVFLRLVSGSITGFSSLGVVKLCITERTSPGGVFIREDLGSDIKGTVSTSWQRFSLTATLTGGGTVGAAQPVIRIDWPDTVVVNFNIRIGWPQMELGAFVTTPIRTTSATAQRGATGIGDLDVTLAVFPTFASSFSYYMHANIVDVSSTRMPMTATTVALPTFDTNNRLIDAESGNGFAGVYNGTNLLTATAGSGGWTTTSKVAGACATGSRKLCMNAGTVASDANTNLAPTAIRITDHNGSGAYLVKRVAFWTANQLSSANLQTYTTL